MSWLPRLLCAAALLIVVSGLVAPPAQAQDKRSYFVAWMITPDTPPSDEAVWVKPYHSIASAKLLPIKLFALSADVAGPDGALILPAGTKVIALMSKTKAACTLEAPPTKGLAALWFLGVDRYVCFIDDNEDGKFDRYFRRSAAPVGILIGYGKFPKETLPIAPASYEAADPASIENPPRIYVQYGWFASFVNQLIFQTCLVADTSGVGCLSPDATVKRTALPTAFEALGATFRVEAKDENRVQVRMLTQFQTKPLIIY